MKNTQTTLTIKDIINKVASTAITITRPLLLSSLQVLSVVPSVGVTRAIHVITILCLKNDKTMPMITHMLLQIDQTAHYFQTTSITSTCYDLISYIITNSQVQ